MPVLEKPPAGGGQGIKAEKSTKPRAWKIYLTKEDQKLSEAVEIIYE